MQILKRTHSPVLLLLALIMPPGRSLPAQAAAPPYLGFDRNLYPGDSTLAALHRHFSFVGFWLTNPPGERTNTWQGKRARLAAAGFGFLVLANGRTEAQIKAAARSSHQGPAALGQADARAAIAAAQAEQFPAQTILFLDQEEGGRLDPPQAAYLLGWTETVAASHFRPGAYLSGQPVPDGPGHTITTAQDVRARVAAQHLHPVVLFVYQDACPPSNGCSLSPPPLAASGTPGAPVWQFAQSPRRPDTTRACARTYAADGNCYVPAANPADKPLSSLFLDLSVASTADPSAGR